MCTDLSDSLYDPNLQSKPNLHLLRTNPSNLSHNFGLDFAETKFQIQSPEDPLDFCHFTPMIKNFARCVKNQTVSDQAHMKSFSRCVRHWRSIAIHHWKIHNKTVHGFLSAYSFIGHTTLSSFDRRLLFYFISSFSSISASHCVHLSSSQKHYVCEEHLLCVHLLVVLTRQANLPMLLLLVLVFRSSLPHRVDFFETKPAPVRLGPGRTLRFYDRPRVALVLYDV